MRLIDADELGKYKFHPLPYTYVIQAGVEEESYVRGWNDAIDSIIESVPDAVTSRDVAKRVLWTGWKGYRDTRYKCPGCNKPVRNDDVVAQDRRWKYSFAGDTEERLKQAIDDMIRLGPFLGASWWSEVTV